MIHYNFSFIAMCLVTGGFIFLLSLRLVTLIHTAQAEHKNALLALSTLMLGVSIWLSQVMHGLAFPLIIKTGFSLSYALLSWLAALMIAFIILLAATQIKLSNTLLCCAGLAAGLGVMSLFYFSVMVMQIQPAVTFSPSITLITLVIAITSAILIIHYLFTYKLKAHLVPFRKQLILALIVSLGLIGLQQVSDIAVQVSNNANSAFPLHYDSVLLGVKIGLGFICLFFMPFIIAVFYDKFKFRTYLWAHLRQNLVTQSMPSAAEMQTWQAELEVLFSYDALQLLYQIKVDSHSRVPLGLEAFLRWEHPSKGLLTPLEFMPIAKQLGMHEDIDDWVIEESCRMLHRLKALQIHLPISVNLSEQQLTQTTLVPNIVDTLKRFDLHADNIRFEIPELLAFKDETLLKDQLNLFKTANIHIAIDDFGTQSSTLAHLQNLEVSELKLGPALTADIEHNPKTRSVIQAVIEMAHALALNVVAESVETEGQRHCLMDLGCDEMQGFIISPPLPEPRLIMLLQNLGLNKA